MDRVGRLQPNSVAQLMVQILEGLRVTHEAGLVHHDIKPDNILLVRNEPQYTAKLVGFGNSKSQSYGSGPIPRPSSLLCGTPGYIAPERIRGGLGNDHRSDLYSVGVVMYEAVTSRLPFDGSTMFEQMVQTMTSDPTPAQVVVPGIDVEFANIITKAMSRGLEQRFRTAVDLKNELANWQAKSCGRLDCALDSHSRASEAV